MYSNSPKIGVKPTIKNAASSWNQIDELRALASFIVRINIANRNNDIDMAAQNRKELCKIVPKIHSDEVRGFQIISVIFQLHSIIFMAA